MKTLDTQLKAMNLERAEEAADALLKLIRGETPMPGDKGRSHFLRPIGSPALIM